jgi:hypothetical protein
MMRACSIFPADKNRLISLKHFQRDLPKNRVIPFQTSIQYGSHMETICDTEQAISQLVAAAGNLGMREAYLYRQSLLALVRLAKAEQMREVRESVTRLIGEESHTAPGATFGAQGSRPAFNSLN